MPLAALRTLLAAPPDLPAAAGLAELVARVGETPAVLQSPPGSGKTTLVPPALAVALEGRVVVAQPRRIAARAAASRLAELLSEPVGATSGYAVRGERRTSRDTRVEFVTAGLLLRRLQHDPELPGVAGVVLDEVHERQVESDLLLAMLPEVRATLRDDLALVAMSATLEADRVADLLGAAVVSVPGTLHPVRTVWAPAPAGVPRLSPRGTDPRFLDHVAATVRQAMGEQDGDVLTFLPGAREVDEVVRRLSGLGADVLALHGRLPPAEQDRALRPGPRRRVVVATAVAESSLTVPGVRAVVDSGLAREPHTDHSRGLAGLVTRNVSQAAADQRAGRAGREGPGVVYRCWTAGEHAAFARHPQPEILSADLTSAVLELAAWGAPRGAGLRMLDRPPQAAVEAAEDVLRSLGAVDPDGQITGRGRTIARLGTDPRLARALHDGAELVGPRLAAEVVALLAEDTGSGEVDLPAVLRRWRREGRPVWRREVRRWQDRVAGHREAGEPPELDIAVGLVTALAQPGRIARRRGGSGSYLLASGAGARLPAGPLDGSEWLAVAEATRAPGQADALIRSAAPIDAETALEAGAGLVVTETDVAWRAGRLVTRVTTRLGAIELSSAPLPHPSPELVTAALREGLRTEGLDVIGWSAPARALRERLAFLHASIGEPWPDVSDEALLERVDEWLGPDLARVRTARDLQRVDTLAALRRLLPWPEAGRLDELAPERVVVPSGSRLAVDYRDPARPTLAVRIQEVFGWSQAPALAGGRVPLVLELLSPARRPAAVTADLAGFWQTGYHQVRAELRGRYPKHPWPQDPATAVATTRTKPRR